MLLSQDEIVRRARSLQMLVFDVDGVLTDGAVAIHSDGGESKRFFVRDGAALIWARRQGLHVGLLSGRASEATTRRARELGIETVIQGQLDKAKGFDQILADHGLREDEVGYMGDDFLDLPVLARAGLAAAPADATPEVRGQVHWVSALAGGHGAARAFVELVLRARGRWDAVVTEHLAS